MLWQLLQFQVLCLDSGKENSSIGRHKSLKGRNVLTWIWWRGLKEVHNFNDVISNIFKIWFNVLPCETVSEGGLQWINMMDLKFFLNNTLNNTNTKVF
jgi:hypothetical protein